MVSSLAFFLLFLLTRLGSAKRRAKEWTLSFWGSGKKEGFVKREALRIPLDILQRDGGFLGAAWFLSQAIKGIKA
jgi:hypothetical protein